MSVIRRISSIVVASLILSGCLGAATRIEIREDGSGSVTFAYRIAKIAAYLGSENSEDRYLGLPLSEPEVESLIAGIEGVELASYAGSENDTDHVFDISIAFESLDALESLFLNIDGPRLEVSSSADTTNLEITIYQGLETEAQDTITEMIRTLFADYELAWTVVAPQEITAASAGNIDGDTADVAYDTPDVLLSTDPLSWTVSW